MIRSIRAYAIIDREKLRLNAMEIYNAKDGVVLGKNEIGVLVEIKAIEPEQSQKHVQKSRIPGKKKLPRQSKR